VSYILFCEASVKCTESSLTLVCSWPFQVESGVYCLMWLWEETGKNLLFVQIYAWDIGNRAVISNPLPQKW